MMITALTQDHALSLARQRPLASVELVAVDYNWGPPISGRYDSDYLNLWAVVGGDMEGTLYLQGQEMDGEWSINAPFKFIQTVQGHDSLLRFHALKLESMSQFPREFVLRFDGRNGHVTYDNNRGSNYRLEPYLRRGASAIATSKAIFVLNGITRYQLCDL
ncbi:hypothetical protein WMF38_38695 [Sorangium sp. So ce118]